MATETVKYAEEATFDVKFKRVTLFRGVQLLPLPVHEMTGAALNEVVEAEGDDVVDFANRR